MIPGAGVVGANLQAAMYDAAPTRAIDRWSNGYMDEDREPKPLPIDHFSNEEPI
jgi:hypothetical protein